MDAPGIEVTESKAIDETIKSIYLNYMQLMIDCANDETVKEDFLNNTHYYLNEKVGMKIPDSVQIELDYDKLQWAEVYIKTEEGKIFVGEGKLALSVVADLTSEDKINELSKSERRVELKEQANVEVKIDEALKKSKVVVRLPFFDTHKSISAGFYF